MADNPVATLLSTTGRFRTLWPAALVFACAACAQAPAPPQPAILFAVQQQPNGSFALEPLFEIEKGHLQKPPSLNEGNDCRAFPPEYSSAGKSYSLLFGGARVGTATLMPMRRPTTFALLPNRVRHSSG